MATQSIDDDDIKGIMQDFRIEHGREPYSSHEFTKWCLGWEAWAESQISAHLKAIGLKVTVSGKIVNEDGSPARLIPLS
jgi:hypothetical protein